MTDLIYYSSPSNNTHRFVERLGLTAQRIPVKVTAETPVPVATGPYVLIFPSYGGDHGKRSILPQVQKFLAIEANRLHLLGVISCGNRNFGDKFCIAGHRVSEKLGVPHLYQVEVFGTSEDVDATRAILASL